MTAQELADLKPHTRTFGLLEWSIEASAMLRQQAAQIESLKADAERYRWLRDSDSLAYPSVDLSDAFHRLTGSFLDGAIDAMKGAT